MFKSIKYLRHENDKYIYQLTDSDFTCEAAVEVAAARAVTEAPMAAAVEYKKRNLPVVSNIALLYLFYHKRGYSMDTIQRWVIEGQPIIDKYCPELEYGAKYYPEIKDRIEKLSLLQ